MGMASVLGGRIVALAMLGIVAATGAEAWERPHADGANSGFVDVATLPAEAPAVVTGIGTFAAGAGPAIAADGTVYLGNKEGQVMSFRPDGGRGWTENITPGFSIVASPVIDSEGSIYVVGTRTVRNLGANPPTTRSDSILYKFLPSGLRIWQADFPDGFEGPAVSAPPNIWRAAGESDVVMVPADYHNKLTGGYETRLIAFSAAGAVIGDVRVKSVVYQVYGTTDMPLWCQTTFTIIGCLLGSDFNPSGLPSNPDPAALLPADTVAPRPGVAVFSFPGAAGTPFILVSNQWEDLVAYTFAHHQFQEIFRVHDEDRLMLSPPMVTRDGHTVINTIEGNRGAVLFAGPNTNAVPAAKGPISYAAPTRTADGRIAIVERFGQMSILTGGAVTRKVALPGQSIVSAAASRTHVFVSTAGSFLTYDTATWEKVAEISWVGGGLFTPAIGPFGHVYGMASNVLFVFPPPMPTTAGPLVADPATPVVGDPGQPVVTQGRQRFDAPMTPAGTRLFACQGLEDGDCGKSASKAVALAFCQQQGFTKLEKFDTEKRNGAAARLDGQLCPKNKCKVFDKIVCEN